MESSHLGLGELGEFVPRLALYGSKELAYAALWLGILFVWTLGPLAGYDFWFYIALGQEMMQSGHIPWSQSYLGTTSVQSFGRYAEEAWLGNLFCYFVYAVCGPLGLVFLKSSLLTATTWLVYRSSRLVGLEPFWAASWATLALWTIRGRFEMRTYLFSDFFLALLVLTIIFLERKYRLELKVSRAIFFLPFLFALWSNVHQGILAGFIVLGCWVLGGGLERKIRIVLALACFGASLLKPHSLDFASFLYDHFSNSSAMSGIVEWGRPSPNYIAYQLGLFFLCLLLIGGRGFLFKLRAKELPPWSYLITALAFSYAALSSIRSTAELLPIVCPFGAAYFCKLPSKPVWHKLTLVALSYLLFSSFYPASLQELRRVDGYPRALVDAIPVNHDQVFNSFEFGNYLVYRRIPPFIHGMASLYREQLVLDFNDVLNPTPRRWELVERYRVDTFLLHHPEREDATENLVDTLANDKGWKLERWDDEGLLFLKGKREEGLTEVYPWRNPSWSDPLKAQTELLELGKKSPSAMAERMLSIICLQQHKLDEAIGHALKAVQLKPYFYGGWSQLAVCYVKKGDITKGLESAKKAVMLRSKDAAARYNLALSLYFYSQKNQGIQAGYYRLAAWYQARLALYYDANFSPARQFLGKAL